jgi:CheY-like chemotaxis protein
LIDDSHFLRVANERALMRAGYVVLSAADGEQALRIARENVPDLVLLDMLLPRMSGEEVLRRLKADARTASIPVIVLSSLSQANEKKLKEVGAAAYLEKGRLLDDKDSNCLLHALKEALNTRPASSPQPLEVAGQRR